jgi:hypothetical protein
MDFKRYSASCLERKVGLNAGCSIEDDNILFVDQLPMIDLTLLAKAAESKDVTGVNFFKRCRTLAAQELSRDFMNSFKKLSFNYVTENISIGGIDPERQEYTSVSTGEYYTRKITQHCGDPFTALRVDYIELYSESEYLCFHINVCVDGISEQFEVCLKAGKNRVEINRYGREIEISVPAEVMFQDTRSEGCSCDHTCCFDYFDYFGESCGGTYDTSTESPMVAHVSCVCLPEELVCSYADDLAYALRWKVAACILEDIVTSRRENPLVRSSKDDAKDKVAMILGGADSEGNEVKREESKYWQELWSIQRGVKHSIKKSKCIKCRGTRLASAVGKRG